MSYAKRMVIVANWDSFHKSVMGIFTRLTINLYTNGNVW